MVKQLFTIVLLMVASLTACASDLSLDKSKLPLGFKNSLYADNMQDARSMTLSADGALYEAGLNRIQHRLLFQ